MHRSLSSSTRRSFVARSLGLAAALVGARLAAEGQPVAAGKKQKKKLTKVQIAQKAQDFADACAGGGGIADTSAKPGGVTVTCSNGDGSGRTCTYYSRGTRCSNFAPQPGSLPDLTTQPPWVDPTDAPDDSLEPAAPTIRDARRRRRR